MFNEIPVRSTGVEPRMVPEQSATEVLIKTTTLNTVRISRRNSFKELIRSG